jgi:hypothetical protein
MVSTPVYYINNFPTVTVNDRIVGIGSDILVESLSERLKVLNKPTILNFLIQNVASQFVGQSVEVALDPITEQFKVNGEVVVGVIGQTATDVAVTAILAALGVGTGIVGITIGAVATELIWSSLSETTNGDEVIANLIDIVIRSLRGKVPVNPQILDANGNVLGGAIYKENINQVEELEAIKKLLDWATQGGINNNFPNVVAGANKIRVIEQTFFAPEERVYELYDGVLIDVVSQSLGITKESLLSEEKRSTYANDNNEQIYFSSSTSPESFVFASESRFRQLSNRLFIPLPTKIDEESTRILHPSNILFTNEDRNVLDAYLANDPSSPFFNQDALLIGTGVSNDSLKGSGGNDVFIGGKGNDEIDGRQGGEDIAIFSDNYKNYNISFSTNGSVTIAHLRGIKTDGTDTLTNVEFAKFKDGTLSLIDSLQNRPSQQIGNYIVQQVSADDVIDGTVPIISGSQVYWQANARGSLFDDRTIRFDTNTGLFSGITSSSADSYAILAVNEGKILLAVDYNDRSPNKLVLYTGESLVQVGNTSDFDNRAIIFGDNVLLETRSSSRPRQLVAYNYKNGKTTPLAEKNYSNSSTLPDFSAVSSVVTSGNKIAWAGSIGRSNDTNIFLYDGNITIQIPKIPKIDEVNGWTYSVPDVSNLQLDGNSIFWTSLNPINRGFTDVFFYNGVETRQIAEVSTSQMLVSKFKISGENVVWTELDKGQSIYLYNNGIIRKIYEVSGGGINNLAISGENIVWTELGKGQNLYLYDIGNSSNQPKLLSKNIDTLLYDFSFKLFGEQVVWTANNAEGVEVEALNDGQTQLYTYDGNSVQQLTNIAANSSNYISDFGVSEKVVVWVANDDGENRDKRNPEIFVAKLIQQDPTPTPDPIPTPTPDPIPTPTPDPIPTPTPDPTPTPTPDPIPTPTPNPTPTPTPDPILIPTSKLRVSLVESKSNLVNELAVFTVDDAAGTINGIAPGSEGYVQAALNKARSIFSTIANLPNGFNTGNLSSNIELDTARSLRFMLVKNSTLDNVKKGITPISDLLLSDLSLQQISNLADSVFPLSWKDSFGNTTDFKDFVIKIGANTDTLPLGTALQSKSGLEVIDFRSDLPPNEIIKAEFSVYREAAFNNYVGFYKIDNTDGNITDPFTGKTLKPGDVGYIQTAVSNRVAGIDLKVANNSIETLSGQFISGSLFAPFIIINASPTEVLDTNTQNDPNVYFAFLGANTDGVDHIRLLGNNVFGFEDLPNGGDLDYNDIVIAANFRMV